MTHRLSPLHHPNYVSLNLPHMGAISNNIRQELSSFIRHKAVTNVNLRWFQNTRKLHSWFSVKDRKDLLNRCLCCLQAYVLMQCLLHRANTTKFNQSCRRALNITKLFSMQTLANHPYHRIDFHNPEVIGSDNNWWLLQILESSLIQEHKPELNANTPSMPLCIFNLCFMHPPWRHAISSSVRVPLSYVTANVPRHYVISITAFRVFHFFTTLFSRLTTITCSKLVAEFTKTSTKMSFTSIPLDVIFISIYVWPKNLKRSIQFS